MTTQAYIQITASSGSPSWKFRVTDGGYAQILDKAQSENETIGGLDVAMGAIHETYELILKVRQGRWAVTSSGSYREEPDDYGVLSDLEELYRLNNPNSTPSNVLTLIDNFGETKSIYFLGQFKKVPVSTIIEGGMALFFMPVRFRVIPP